MYPGGAAGRGPGGEPDGAGGGHGGGQEHAVHVGGVLFGGRGHGGGGAVGGVAGAGTVGQGFRGRVSHGIGQRPGVPAADGRVGSGVARNRGSGGIFDSDVGAGRRGGVLREDDVGRAAGQVVPVTNNTAKHRVPGQGSVDKGRGGWGGAASGAGR